MGLCDIPPASLATVDSHWICRPGPSAAPYVVCYNLKGDGWCFLPLPLQGRPCYWLLVASRVTGGVACLCLSKAAPVVGMLVVCC